MDPVNQAIIRYVTGELHRVQQNGIPYGIWVRRYAPVPADFSGDGDIKTPLIQAWFVGSEGGIKEDTCAYQRFQVMQYDQPWCSRTEGEPQSPPAPSRHGIALAAFAAYESSEEFYLEVVWGGTFAHGMCVQIIDGQVLPVDYLWVS